MRISLPFMAGPTSARLRAAVDFLADSVVLLILFGGYDWQPQVYTKKPTTVASRGLLSKSFLASTSHGGIAQYYYSDYCDHDLSKVP